MQWIPSLHLLRESTCWSKHPPEITGGLSNTWSVSNCIRYFSIPITSLQRRWAHCATEFKHLLLHARLRFPEGFCLNFKYVTRMGDTNLTFKKAPAPFHVFIFWKAALGTVPENVTDVDTMCSCITFVIGLLVSSLFFWQTDYFSPRARPLPLEDLRVLASYGYLNKGHIPTLVAYLTSGKLSTIRHFDFWKQSFRTTLLKGSCFFPVRTRRMDDCFCWKRCFWLI